MQQEMTLRALMVFFFFFLILLPCLFTEGWQICQFSRERISENLLLMSLVIPISCSEVLNVLTPHYNRTAFIVSGSRASILLQIKSIPTIFLRLSCLFKGHDLLCPTLYQSCGRIAPWAGFVPIMRYGRCPTCPWFLSCRLSPFHASSQTAFDFSWLRPEGYN